MRTLAVAAALLTLVSTAVAQDFIDPYRRNYSDPYRQGTPDTYTKRHSGVGAYNGQGGGRMLDAQGGGRSYDGGYNARVNDGLNNLRSPTPTPSVTNPYGYVGTPFPSGYPYNSPIYNPGGVYRPSTIDPLLR